MTPKQRIPASLRQSVWLQWIGNKFIAKCFVKWCRCKITPFTFEAGHNIPESKGGETNIENLRPICASCNKSMGNRYTITEYSKKYDSVRAAGGKGAGIRKKKKRLSWWHWRGFRCFKH